MTGIEVVFDADGKPNGFGWVCPSCGECSPVTGSQMVASQDLMSHRFSCAKRE